MKVSRESTGVLFLLAILLIIISAAIAVGISLKSDPIADNLKQDEMIKVLFVMNDGSGNALSTDVLVYYPATQNGVVFDILGNTGGLYASINRTDRIDVIYKELGMETYSREIQKITGIETPFLIEISLQDLGLLTDLLGGLKVFVRSPVDAVAPGGNGRWLLPSGAVTLDGDKTQTYMQYILPDETAADQMERRQNTFVALLDALHSNRALLTSRSDFERFHSLMHSNVEQGVLFNLLSYISSMTTETLVPRTIAGNIRTLNGQQLLFPYEDADGLQFRNVVRQAINSLLHEGPSSRIYTVEVQNGTSRAGLAGNAATLLSNFGYDVLPPSNADRQDYEHTVIISHIGRSEALQTLSDTISCLYVITDDTGLGPENKDFTLILGNDWNGRRVRGGYTGEPAAEED